jgi:hypothetical protein
MQLKKAHKQTKEEGELDGAVLLLSKNLPVPGTAAYARERAASDGDGDLRGRSRADLDVSASSRKRPKAGKKDKAGPQLSPEARGAAAARELPAASPGLAKPFARPSSSAALRQNSAPGPAAMVGNRERSLSSPIGLLHLAQAASRAHGDAGGCSEGSEGRSSASSSSASSPINKKRRSQSEHLGREAPGDEQQHGTPHEDDAIGLLLGISGGM